MIDIAVSFNVLHSTAPGLVGKNHTKSWGYSGVETTGLRRADIGKGPMNPETETPEGEPVHDIGSFA